jgi:hypothetical protein
MHEILQHAFQFSEKIRVLLYTILYDSTCNSALYPCSIVPLYLSASRADDNTIRTCFTEQILTQPVLSL